jgi:Cu/Ag efflux protein CusF
MLNAWIRQCRLRIARQRSTAHDSHDFHHHFQELPMRRFLSTIAALAISTSAFACYHLNEAVVKQVDASNNTVVVDSNGTQKTFTTAATTKIQVNGKEAKLTDIKAGDKVNVDYEASNDVLLISVSRQS